jgi:single-stranded-DNA-specific exonuclease
MKLLRQANVNQRFLTEDDIAFMVSPRINAASRMGVPMDAFSLLSTTDQTEADHFATHLNTINNERKGIVAALVKEAKKIIRERFGGAHGGGADAESKMPGVIVIGNPEWKPALLGLAANSCGEEFGCPVFLWGRDGDGVIKGSCRSDGVTDLVALMHETPTGTFLQFGGHAMSGGFSVTNDMIHTLPETLNKAFDGVKKARKGPPEVLVDKELLLADVNWDTYRMIEKLAPFGVGNPKPLFIFRNIVPVEVREFGKEKNHLEIIFENVTDYFSGQPNKVSAIGFFMTASDWKEAAALGHDIIVGKPITLVANLEKSMFRGRKELRLRIVDIIAATII